MKRNFIISAIISLLLAGVACAGDSLSLSISCTIPAIPGLNAPLIEEETLKVESQKEIQPQIPAMIQQDTQEEKLMHEEQNSLVLVKTIYSR